jgi:Ribbon-helix-helix protein, copG family
MTNDESEHLDQVGKLVSFRAPQELARRLEREAGRELLSVSAFVRRAVLQSLSLSAPDHL